MVFLLMEQVKEVTFASPATVIATSLTIVPPLIFKVVDPAFNAETSNVSLLKEIISSSYSKDRSLTEKEEGATLISSVAFSPTLKERDEVLTSMLSIFFSLDSTSLVFVLSLTLESSSELPPHEVKPKEREPIKASNDKDNFVVLFFFIMNPFSH